jgi:predicted enzyme related to lactoylglutathione lyase
MGARTEHEPGTFSWAELATSDADAAKAFYGDLFGWEVEDHPIPGGDVYTMLKLGGRSAAALYQSRQGAPPGWGAYVTVGSVDEVAPRAEQAGGVVSVAPMDVMDVGRMAVIQDPGGATVSLWEPRASIGAEVVNAPGALTLNQLNASDPERSQEFYSAVFGWRFERLGTEQPYWGIYNGDRLNAGMMQQPPDFWLTYFGSEDVDDDAGRIAELGGQVLVEPMAIESGRIVVAQDPQGAVFALFSGVYDD